MPFVSGFLRIRRRGGHPDQELPEGERPVDPDYGIDEGGEHPEIDPPIPEPPHGIWPPLTPEHPWRPLPGLPTRPGQGLPPHLPPAVPGQPLPRPPNVPGQPLPPEGTDEHPDTGFPPGAIWPPLPPGVHGKYLALVLVAGMPGVRYRYVVIDADARPPHRPDNTLPGVPEREPK